MDAEGVADDRADDADHDQEGEFGTGSIRNDIFTERQKEDRRKNNEQNEGRAGDCHIPDRVGMGQKKQHQQSGDFSSDGADGHFSLLAGVEAGVG